MRTTPQLREERNAHFADIERSKESAGWTRLFLVYLEAFIFNLTSIMPDSDPYKSHFLALAPVDNTFVPATFMSVIEFLCNGLEARVNATTPDNTFMNTFNTIVEKFGCDNLQQFSVYMKVYPLIYDRPHEQISEETVKKCYEIRNYLLMREVLQYCFDNSYVAYDIKERLPDTLLFMLGISELF